MAGWKNEESWMVRFMKHYIEEAEFDPETEKNALTVKTFRSIAQMSGLRCAGMDPRKIAQLAADMFKYQLLNRQRAIDEVARIAVKDVKDLEAQVQVKGE